MFLKTRQLNFVVVAIAVFWGATIGLTPANAWQDYDFNNDILVILKQRCLTCHSGDNREGDLWLDSREAMLAGGHTGSPLLGKVEESELLARIESTEAGYRMPKDGPPLTDQQQKTFRKWVADGAPWPEPTSRSGNSPGAEKNFADKAGDLWLKMARRYEEPSWMYASWIVIPAVIIAFFMLLHRVLYRRRQRLKDESPLQPLLRSWLSGLAWLGIICLAALSAFLWGRVEEGQTEISDLKKFGPPKKLQKTFGVSFDEPPKVVRPMHPKRLGGRYYRGNDERNKALFNEGFYRTADMHVQLVDGDGKPVDYDTQVDPSSLAIEFRFDRSKGATKKLFSKRVLQTGFISSSWGGTEKATDRVLFQPIGGEDHWAVTFPLKLSGEGPFRGDLFIYYGPLERNRIHYQIRYDIRIDPDDGSLDPESEVWMGSTYDLGGRVISGRGGQILLDRWFDFRPIPEIEGKNADSPELLGLPEHLK